MLIPVIAATAVVCHRRHRRREREAQQQQQVVIGTPVVGAAPPSTTGAYPHQAYPHVYPMGGPGYPVMEGTPVLGVPVGPQPVYAQMSTRDLRRAHKEERREERREYRTERRALKSEIRAQRQAGLDIRAGAFQPQRVHVQPVYAGQPCSFTQREDDSGFVIVDQQLSSPPVAPAYVAPGMPVYDAYAQASAPPMSKRAA